MPFVRTCTFVFTTVFVLYVKITYSFISNTKFVVAKNFDGRQLLSSNSDIEQQLIDLLKTVSGRGSKISDSLPLINEKIDYLDNARGIKNPSRAVELDGCWKLLFTSSPKTNSPIQRTVTALDGVSVYQVVNVVNTSNSFLPGQPDVSNTVCFGESARLRVTALASTITKPLVTPRIGDGKIFGLNVFGVSSSSPPRDPNERIDFAFQEARFEFQNLPITIPYPVPFKLLGDEAKGWIDVTYLSNKVRVLRGNKGTLFVLQKVDTSLDPIGRWAASTKSISSSSGATSTSGRTQPPSPVTTAAKTSSFQQSAGSPLALPAKVPSKTSPPSLVNTLPSWLQSLHFLKSPIKETGPEPETVTIIFPCQLGEKADYDPLVETLSQRGVTAVAAPLGRLDWPIGLLPSFFSSDYLQGTLKPKTLTFYFKKVDEAVAEVLREKPNARINILGHSIGGWIARAWLSEWCSADIKSRVRALVTIGSPHNPPPPGSRAAKVDQTRGLLSYIYANFPGAYEPTVAYTSVIGSGVKANWAGPPVGKLALLSYSALGGDGSNAEGDGLIPVSVAALSGAKVFQIEEALHSNFVPLLPGYRIKLPVVWYGSEEVIDQWVSCLQ